MIEDVIIILFIAFIIHTLLQLFKFLLLPKLIEKTTKEIEKNPKWIASKINYYGFHDIDIILATGPDFALPRLRISKENRYELLVSNDISTKEVDDIIRLALLGKIQVKYGLFFPDKPLHWLSILCYMLDGGDIKEEATSWEAKNK